jgi:hypothetical protein
MAAGCGHRADLLVAVPYQKTVSGACSRTTRPRVDDEHAWAARGLVAQRASPDPAVLQSRGGLQRKDAEQSGERAPDDGDDTVDEENQGDGARRDGWIDRVACPTGRLANAGPSRPAPNGQKMRPLSATAFRDSRAGCYLIPSAFEHACPRRPEQP